MARRKQINKKKSYNKNSRNYQDNFADKEYDKGYDAGRATAPIVAGSKDNDPSWYVPNGTLLSNVASFPYGISTGLPINTSSFKNSDIQFTGQDQEVPGILVFNMLHTLGTGLTSISPINVAMNAEYTALQSGNSRTPSYEPNDMMLYQLALADCYAFHMWMTRIYGIMNNYEMLNRYTPQGIIRAMNVNFEDIKANMANFRTYINQFAYILSSFFLPKSIDYVKRRIFLYESVYTDSDNSKAQYYMYNPVGFYRWVEGASGGVAEELTHLDTVFIRQYTGSGQPLTTLAYADIVNIGDMLINPLRSSEDIRMISADMLKLFGAGNSFPIYPIADTYVVKPVYSREVLSQMENAYVAPPIQIASGGKLNTVTQAAGINQGWLQSSTQYHQTFETPKTQDVMLLMHDDQIIVNMHDATVSPESTMVATRLAINPQLSLLNGNVVVNVASTEVVVGAQIYTFSTAGTIEGYEFQRNMCVTMPTNATPTQVSTMLWRVASIDQLLSKFDWHPQFRHIFMLTTEAGDVDVINASEYSFDIDNFTVISQAEMLRLNEIALLGLFTCDLPGTLNMSSKTVQS